MKRHKPQKRGVKLRVAHLTLRGKPQNAYSFTVPPEIATRVPDNSRFAVELTEDGILFRIIKPPAGLPKWVKSEPSSL